MSHHHEYRDRSYDPSRVPRGTLLVAALIVVLAAGVYLVIAGLS
jgi:hypothetical protein